MAFVIDILKHASVSSVGSNSNIVSSPVWFYVCALHLRSEPAKALKNMSSGNFKNRPQFTQHRTPFISSPINKHFLSTHNIIKNSTSNQNQVGKNKKSYATKTKFTPIKCIKNRCWLPLATEYGFIY